MSKSTFIRRQFMIPRPLLCAGAISITLIAGATGGYMLARQTSAPAAVPVSEAAPSSHANADTLRITEEAIRETGVTVEPVEEHGLDAEIIAQATVGTSPAGEATVTAHAAGSVTRILKRLGDPVRAGETLGIVESRDAAQLLADRRSAGAKAELAQRALDRERYLYEQKVSAKVDLERAEAEAGAAMAEAQRARTAAETAHVTPDGRGVAVLSPITGLIAGQSITLGAFVQPETPLFHVADPKLAQIEAAIGPADIGRIEVGTPATVDLGDGRSVSAKVRAFTPTLDGDTRSATVVLDFEGEQLPPGLAVRVRLLPARSSISGKTVVVPESAVQSVKGRDCVFVRTAGGFVAQVVTIGRRSAGRVEILSGLGSGRMIATNNAFLLKAETARGAGGED